MMEKVLDVKYVIGEDWEGIYINNELENEGHSIRFGEGFELISEYINDVAGVSKIDFNTYEVSQEWLENEGNLPQKFDNIPINLLKRVVIFHVIG